jgi:hypothetical protein
MRRLLLLLLLVLIPVPSAALADGCPPSMCGTTSVAPPGSPVTLVRRLGQQGPAEAYDLATGARSFRLPVGVLSADGRTFASTSVVKIAGGGMRTMLRRYDARTGRMRSITAIPGSWHVTAVSAEGRRAGLMQYHKRGVEIAVADSALRFRERLPGNWEIEALSPSGYRVFLIHWNRAGGYTLENIDTRTRRVRLTPLEEPGEKMSGFAQTAVATRDGRWLLTLYLKGDEHTFLHALDLGSGLAHCVDLPLIGDPASVGSTAMTLSPDERNLYLASPFLGSVLTVDLAGLRVTRRVELRPLPAGQNDISVGPSAAMTRNGRMLAFYGAKTLWLYDAAYGVVRHRVRTESTIVGVGFRPEGRRLVAITAEGKARAFDAATGAPSG